MVIFHSFLYVYQREITIELATAMALNSYSEMGLFHDIYI